MDSSSSNNTTFEMSSIEPITLFEVSNESVIESDDESDNGINNISAIDYDPNEDEEFFEYDDDASYIESEDDGNYDEEYDEE